MLTRHFLEFANLLPEALLLVSSDGNILSANRAAKHRLGVADGDLQGKTLYQFVTAPDSIEPYLRSCRRSKQVVLGALVLRSQNGILPCRAEGALLQAASSEHDGLILLRLTPKETAASRFLSLNEKIDELSKENLRRKLLEEALRQQRAWFEVALSSIGDAVIATDEAGRITFINPVAEGLTGWRKHEAIGQTLETVFQIINEETRRHVEDPVSKVIQKGAIVGLANHTLLIDKNGVERSIDDSAAPIRDSQGSMIGVILIFRDISERRKDEAKLQQSQQDLQERVQELEQFHDIVVDRELKMIALEQEVASLKQELEKRESEREL